MAPGTRVEFIVSHRFAPMGTRGTVLPPPDRAAGGHRPDPTVVGVAVDGVPGWGTYDRDHLRVVEGEE